MAAQAVWIATAVESLVVMANDREDVRSRGQRPDDALADDGVRAHLPFLVGVEGSWLGEDCGMHPNLADVVDQSATVQRDQVKLSESQSRADVQGGVRHSLSMTFGVRIPGLGGGRQRENELFGVMSNGRRHGGPHMFECAAFKVTMPRHGCSTLSLQVADALNP